MKPLMFTTSRRTFLALSAGVAIASLALVTSADAASYRATLIPKIAGGTSIEGLGINNDGVVVGRANDSEGLTVPFVFANGALSVLPLLPGHFNGSANAINNAGVVVGESRPDVGPSRAVIWTKDTAGVWTVTDLGTLNPDESGLGVATDINDAGQICGYVGAPADGRFAAYHAVYWDASIPLEEDIGVLGFVDIPGTTTAYSQALGISSTGDVCGFAYGYLQGPEHGLRRILGSRGAEDISPPEHFATSQWFSMNASKTMVGFVRSLSVTGNATLACRHEDGVGMSIIPLVSNVESSVANDINDSGVIVGTMNITTAPDTSVQHAFVVDRDGPVDLGLIATGQPDPIADAKSVSADGKIVANAWTVDGAQAYIIVTTCPADFDNNGSRTIDDIFVFINAWFAQDPRADFDHMNGINIDDIFIFINAWFAGC
jgi:uncharacterized membrane protein